MTVGPVEIVVLGFDGPVDYTEIRRGAGAPARTDDVVRLVKRAWQWQKTEARRDRGTITALVGPGGVDKRRSQFGTAVGALIGLGAGGESGLEAGAVLGEPAPMADGHLFGPEDSWAIAERIPAGTAAVVALVEHRWRIPVRDAVQAHGRSTARGRLGTRRRSDRARSRRRPPRPRARRRSRARRGDVELAPPGGEHGSRRGRRRHRRAGGGCTQPR